MTSNVTLLQGDCLEILPTLPSGSVDAIITDLPYGTTACKWDEVIPFAPMWAEVKRVLKPRGAFVTTASQPFVSRLVASNLDMFRHEWIWDKVSAASPVNSLIGPKRSHESVLIFGQTGHTYNPVMWNAGKPNGNRGSARRQFGVGQRQDYDKEFSHKSNENERYPVSVIRLSYQNQECNNTIRIHPTQKPVALYEYLIRTYTNEGDTVLDFTMGSGTTGVAAINTGRHFVGIEKDANYFAIAQRRIEDAQAQPLLLETV
jgi:DNA modification methylase